MLPGTRKGTNSGRSAEAAGTNISRSRRGAAAGSTGDEVNVNLHSYVLWEFRMNMMHLEVNEENTSVAG